ncbi:MAG: hypothetical protein QMD11_11695, partial [Smithella sp.]|nr:hypothetical protein [Smithella sp.]
ALSQRLAGFDGLLVMTVSLIALLYMHLALRVERSGEESCARRIHPDVAISGKKLKVFFRSNLI